MVLEEYEADAYIAGWVAIAFVVSIVLPLYTYELLFRVFSEITLGLVSGFLTLSISIIYSLSLFQLIRALPRIRAKKESIKMQMLSVIMLQCFVWLVLALAVQLSPGRPSFIDLLLNLNTLLIPVLGYVGIVFLSCLILYIIITILLKSFKGHI